MAYGRSGYRRRLGYKRGSYASTMGLRPVPFTRKRKYPGKSSGVGAPPRLGRRVRPRMARSYVFTKTQTKKRGGKITSHGDNASSSMNMIGNKWLSAFERMMSKKIAAPQTIFTNTSGSVSSTQGKQNWVQLVFLDKASLVGIETAANGGTATDNSVRFMLKSGKQVVRLRNQSNTNSKVSIYDVVTKRDTPATAYDTPGECWTKGLTDFGYAVGYNTVGQVPMRSPEFRNYFAVNRVTTVNLEPGQQHDHTVFHRYNKIVNSVRFQNAVGTSLAGLTRFVFIVFHGTLAHDTAAPSSVTYAPITLDWAVSREYTYGIIEKVTPSYTLTDNNPTTVVDLDAMLESGDNDLNPAAA